MVSPPCDRTSDCPAADARFAPSGSAGTGGMLVRTHDGGIDAGGPVDAAGQVVVHLHAGQDHIKGAAPSIPLIDGSPVAVPLGPITGHRWPTSTRSSSAACADRPTGRLGAAGRAKRLDPPPRRIGQPMSSHHDRPTPQDQPKPNTEIDRTGPRPCAVLRVRPVRVFLQTADCQGMDLGLSGRAAGRSSHADSRIRYRPIDARCTWSSTEMSVTVNAPSFEPTAGRGALDVHHPTGNRMERSVRSNQRRSGYR